MEMKEILNRMLNHEELTRQETQDILERVPYGTGDSPADSSPDERYYR